MLYSFNACSLDTQRRELSNAEGVLPLRPKVFDLLIYLIENRDRVVPKDELFDRLWPNVHVGDATLNTCIKAVRQAVGDDGRKQAVIRTWHGHGYRFVAGVEMDDGDSSAPDPGEPTTAKAEAEPRGEAADRVPPLNAFPSGKEHKQVTVLHCALPNAGALAAELGAEAMDEVMDRFLSVAASSTENHGGTVIRWLGDGFVALFGAPRAAEDHARRAVLASLVLLKRLAAEPVGLAPQIGLHTGPVVVGTTEAEPDQVYTAAGLTTETARQLQEAAPPGAVLASQKTAALVQSEVDAEPLQLGGSRDEAPIPIYRIKNLIARQSGVPRRSGRLLSRFVGRERELAILQDALDRLPSRGGQVISIGGEPGIGKSRLVEEFERGLAAREVRSVGANCLSYAGASPYLPIRRLLRQLCGIESGDAPDRMLAKLDAGLAEAGISASGARASLGQLLDLPVDRSDLDRFSPEERRAQSFDVLYCLAAHHCSDKPLVLVIEDLHWIDATSEAWLSGLVMRLAGLQLLLLVTYRPGYRPPWLPQSSATQLALSSLQSDVSDALVRSIATARPLSEDDRQNIVAKAQGNPFFLEELAWALGSGSYGDLGIPETVQSLLAARIDGLALPDKRLLQIAAVVGPEVPYALLVAIDGLTEEERRDSLLHLQTAEFLFECQTLPVRIFAFKHALTQEVAYLSLVARTRKEIHRRIADALETEFQPLVRGRPELVAHHLTESGELNRASRAWLEAGRRAIERSANAEAVAHLNKALEFLASLPDGPDRREREIATRLAHGVALQFTEGPGATKTERTYRKAAELCATAGDGLSLFFATWGLWRVSSANSKMQSAQDLAGDLLQLAEEHEDPTLRLQAHHAHWTTLYNHGEFDLAAEHIAQGLALYDPAQHDTQAFLVAGHDPRICAHTTAAQVLWVTGFPDQAMKRTLHANALADGLGHPSTRAIAINHMLRLCISCRDPETVKQWQKALRSLAVEYEFPGHKTCCDLAEIWVNARETGSDAGIRAMIDRLAKRPDLAGLEEPMAICLIAESCRYAGLLSEGLQVLADLQARPDVSARSSWGAEFDRLKGELLLSGPEGDQAEAEARFRSAMATASGNRAKVLELRSATSLARLWDKQGKAAQARDLLEPIYSWFTEGHDTRDLLDARQLLEKLSR